MTDKTPMNEGGMLEVHNINELVGIIKGINFDGIVNDKEVVHLRSWVDKNRNLVCRPRQVELIELVDCVLEDKIITEKERELMLYYANDFLKDNADEASKIYELNEIIEGIVCDEKVNEQEVYHLKAWMDAYGNLIRGHKSSKKICEIVEDILADDIVTEEEQAKLLHMLSERINGSQYETKLEYLRNLVKTRKNIGIELIDMLDNEDAMGKIHGLAESQLKKALNSYTGSIVAEPEIVFISLVLIAMLEYDANFYSKVETTYTELYHHYPEQKIEGLIRTILSRYRTDKETNTSRTRIISVALTNAIVPSHYLAAFFEVVFDIYKLNFEYTLPDDLYEEFQFAYEGLRESMMSEGDDVKIKVTRKTYKLIKSTKQLIADANSLDPVIKLSIIIVKLIDKQIWNKNIRIFNPYLKKGYEGWIETLKEDTTGRNCSGGYSEIRSRWEPKYIIDNNEIYIVPPIHKVKSEYNYRDIHVVIFNGNEEIYSNAEPDIREIIGGYQISVNRIKIQNPLGKITYRLLSGKNIIYDSKEKLLRKYIIFDVKGNEIQNNSDYSGTVIFCYKRESEKLKAFFSSSTYNLASLNVKEGDAYVVEDTVFNFSSLIKPGIFGEEYENCYLIKPETEEKIYVYKQVKYLVFESNNITSNYEIVINGNMHRLLEYKYTLTEREGVNKYVLNLDVEQSGIYAIAVYQRSNGDRTKLAYFNLALDKHLEVDELKLDDENYIVTIKTDLCSSTINANINVGKFSEDWLKIEVNGQLYCYYIPFRFDIYRVSGYSWASMVKSLWIGNITQESVLDVYGNDINELRVYASVGEILDEVLRLKNCGVYKSIPIGFLVSYKVSYDYAMLLFMQDGVKQRTLFCYNRCIMDEDRTELVFDPVTKRFDVTTYYYGEGKVFFTITDAKRVQVYKSEFIDGGTTVQILGLESFKQYDICFWEKEKGLSLKKERLMKKYTRVLYAWDEFVGRTFKVCKVYFDQLVRGEFVRKSHCFNKSYVTFIAKEGDDMYRGELFTRTLKGDYMLSAVNPVSIEICSEVMGNSLELSITKDGDGLFLDFEHHGIKNILVDDSATDIFSYTIEMNGVETIG